ncbi:MAG: hypothetical protein COB10_06210 [Planctomycetota bacterium]|nr:MAG: hypothetical protein COB10_06210 [Planctomycetota bacterium]
MARLQVEHIRPKKHGGADDEANLALACIHCNSHKGSNLTGIDPQTEEIVELFHLPQQLSDFELSRSFQLFQQGSISGDLSLDEPSPVAQCRL